MRLSSSAVKGYVNDLSYSTHGLFMVYSDNLKLRLIFLARKVYKTLTISKMLKGGETILYAGKRVSLSKKVPV